MKYDTYATKATEAGLSPATAEQTAALWRELGVTRQTGWNWRDPERVPLMARLAAAWLIHVQASKLALSGEYGKAGDA